MKSLFLILFSFFSLSLAHSQQAKESKVIGMIYNHTDKKLLIDNNVIPISENDSFSYDINLERPTFYDMVYAGLKWVIYLEPGKTIEIKLTDKIISAVTYHGDLVQSNNYLKTISKTNQQLDSFFRINWRRIHLQNESSFISTIDSLKGLFLTPLDSLSKIEDISDNFLLFFKADVDFGLNSLIIQYPEWHLVYSGNMVSLSDISYDYIKSSDINNLDYFNLPNYKEFGKHFIDYQLETLLNKYGDKRHYYINKMDAVFQLLPQLIENQYLLDFWISEYLTDHIDKSGVQNSKKHVSLFDSMCKTELYKEKIKNHYSSEVENRKDHIIKTYKEIGGFILEAHILYPNDYSKLDKYPAIVIFHGGGWVDGKPAWAFGRAKHFSNQGMIAIAAQYQLSNQKNITPIEAMQDAKDLIIWLRKNADSLGIIPEKIAAEGWSAGGHLVSSAAIFADTASNQAINSSPNALILTSPAIDLANDSWFTKLLSAQEIAPISFSPVDNISAGLPPTIILQGEDDSLTPLKGAKLFNEKMKTSGNYCELWIYENVGHLFTPSHLDDRGWPRPDKKIQKEAHKKIDEFLINLGYIKQ